MSAFNVWAQVRKAFSGAGAHDLSLTDWQQSLFWAFTGTLALGACISSTNQRIDAERGRLELLQQKNELLREVLKVQQQAAKQQSQLAAFEAVLKGEDVSSSSSSSSNSKRLQSWAALKAQLLSKLTV